MCVIKYLRAIHGLDGSCFLLFLMEENFLYLKKKKKHYLFYNFSKWKLPQIEILSDVGYCL